MSEKLKKFKLEEASDPSEASFILTQKPPIFRAAIHVFESYKKAFEFQTDNPTVQVHKLPIFLEALDVSEEMKKSKYFIRTFHQMAHWYFFTVLRTDGRTP